MPRTPDGAEPRTMTVPVRLTLTGLRMLDAARGTKNRSKYLRDLVADDCARRRITLKEKP